jgi:hypothetical protein
MKNSELLTLVLKNFKKTRKSGYQIPICLCIYFYVNDKVISLAQRDLLLNIIQNNITTYRYSLNFIFRIIDICMSNLDNSYFMPHPDKLYWNKKYSLPRILYLKWLIKKQKEIEEK